MKRLVETINELRTENKALIDDYETHQAWVPFHECRKMGSEFLEQQ
jgi:hypothetical protein